MTPEEARAFTALVEQAYRTGYRSAVSDAVGVLDRSRLPEKNLSIILLAAELETTPQDENIELLKRQLTGMMQ